MNYKVGSTTISKIKNQKDIDDFVKSLNIKSDTVLIKPNWVDGLNASHTEAEVLDMFLKSLKRKVIFIESYTFWRNKKMAKQGNKEDYFSSKEATVDTGKKHWNFFKEQDKWFFKYTKLDKLFKKYNAEYISITNEVWNRDTVKSSIIQNVVKKNYDRVNFKELYSYVPEKLYKYKGADLISFAKAKIDRGYGYTLSIKNLFGLIPDPNRYDKYHGEEEENLIHSIINMHKIYHSLFEVKFVVDGVFKACSMDFDTEKTISYDNWGVILGGNNALEIDEIGAKLLGTKLKGALKELPAKYEKNFGGFDKSILKNIPKHLYLKKRCV